MLGNGYKVLIIIPVYNEGPVLNSTIDELRNYRYDILLVDDGSNDGCCEMINEDSMIIKLKHIANLGQGAALKTGMKYALQNHYDVAFHFDADGQHDPFFLSSYIDKMRNEDVDVVLGSRFLNADFSQSVPFKRKCLLMVALYIDRILSGVRLTDVHNGFRVLNRKAMNSLNITSNGMEHASEIIWEIKRAKLTYAEIPVKIRYHVQKHKKGQSLYTAGKILSNLILLKIKRAMF